MVASRRMRMRQSLAQFEEDFREQTLEETSRARDLRWDAAERSRSRRQVKARKQGNVRFAALVMAIVMTAVVVTVVMFETLALLIGGS